MSDAEPPVRQHNDPGGPEEAREAAMIRKVLRQQEQHREGGVEPELSDPGRADPELADTELADTELAEPRREAGDGDHDRGGTDGTEDAGDTEAR
jgi:hypothetical protein